MRSFDFCGAMRRRPDAQAMVRGSGEYPDVAGRVRFYQLGQGVLVVTEVTGLPKAGEGCNCSVFGYHIHSGDACSDSPDDPFSNAMGHYDPNGCPHPCHAGDMPPLFGANGRAFSAFFTDRFAVSEVVGRTVIIHSRPDDFTTQPSGNSGKKIACGVIMASEKKRIEYMSQR